MQDSGLGCRVSGLRGGGGEQGGRGGNGGGGGSRGEDGRGEGMWCEGEVEGGLEEV